MHVCCIHLVQMSHLEKIRILEILAMSSIVQMKFKWMPFDQSHCSTRGALPRPPSGQVLWQPSSGHLHVAFWQEVQPTTLQAPASHRAHPVRWQVRELRAAGRKVIGLNLHTYLGLLMNMTFSSVRQPSDMWGKMSPGYSILIVRMFRIVTCLSSS